MEQLSCVMFFKDSAQLTTAAQECKAAAKSGQAFNNFHVSLASPIHAEELWDEKLGESFLLIFATGGHDGQKGYYADVLRIETLVISDEELMIWLQYYGVAGFEKLLKPPILSVPNKKASHAA